MTINEIAELSGVSRATVSRYLNDGYVSENKRRAIQKVIEETGYEPSVQAQNMRKKVNKLIGVIIPRINSHSVSRMVEGISMILAKEGYQLLLANTQNDIKEEIKYLRIFKKSQVDGVIFMGTVFTPEHKKAMDETDVPIVVVGQHMKEHACVYQDDYMAAKTAAECLLQHGTQIGYIGVTEKDRAAGADRKAGYKAALGEYQGSIATEHMMESSFDVYGGYAQMKELLLRYPQVDSVFCATDTIAVGAMKYLTEQKIPVPSQIQLIGFGDTQLGNMVTPSVTSVHFYYKTTGMEAAKMLLEILETGKDLKKSLCMGYEIKENASTRR